MSDDDRQRPAGLWVIGILALVLGTMGACGGTFGVVGLFFQDAVAEMNDDIQASQPDPQLREINRDMQRELMEVAQGFKWPNLAVQLLNILASFVLIVGGILLFRWHPSATTAMMVGLALSIVVDLAAGGLQTAIGIQNMAVMDEFAQRMGELGDPAAQRMMGGIMRASGSFGLCMGIGWALAKIGFYVGSIVYLRKEKVRRLFA